jgi:CBS domain-containing protein
MVAVKELMSKHIVGVSTETTIESARKLMNSMHVELVPVISEGKLHGILIDSDLRDLQGSDKVGQIMRRPVFTEAESDIEEAAMKLVENAIGRLPVVNNRREMHCVGILSTTDIVNSLK